MNVISHIFWVDNCFEKRTAKNVSPFQGKDMQIISNAPVFVNPLIFVYWSGRNDWLTHKDRWHWVVRNPHTFEKIIESPQDYRSEGECEFAIEMFQRTKELPQGQYIWGGTRRRKKRPFLFVGGAI